MFCVILGMHKSGTTLISKILNESEINMGFFDSNISYDQGNQYERKEFKKINFELLKCQDIHSLDVIKPLPNDYINIEIASLIHSQSKVLNDTNDNWGFKDPRTCLTYNFWNKHLPAHKLILVYRNPLEVFNHYVKHIPKYKFIERFFHGKKVLQAWQSYNKQLLNILHTSPTNCYLIEYTDFMKNKKSIESLSNFLKLQLKDCRDKSLYRQNTKKSTEYHSSLFINKLFSSLDIEKTLQSLNNYKLKFSPKE